MPLAALCSLVGLALGLVGAGLLAVSLNGLLQALALSSTVHDFAIEQLTRPAGDLVVFTGTDKHIERGKNRGTRFIRLGLWLLVASFLGQAFGVVLALP